jgi:hypothetical protein
MFGRMEQHPAPNIKGFFLVIWNDWGARMSGIFTVPFTIAALFAPSEYRAIFAVMAILAFAITAYRIWADERRLLIGLEQHLAPRLRFEFDPQDDRFVCETSTIDYQGIVYIRVLASPLSPVVKNCRAFLKSVSNLNGDKYVALFEDPIPLPWSYENPQAVSLKELNQAVDSFLDVAWFVEEPPHFGLLNAASELPTQLRDVLEFLLRPEPSRNVKLDLLLIGDDSEAATLSLNIHRGNPQWNKPQVGWMTDQTGNEIHNLQSNVSTDLTPLGHLV